MILRLMQYHLMSTRPPAFSDHEPPLSGCQFIAAEKRHYSDADKCGLPQRSGSPYCPAHHAITFLAAPDDRLGVLP